MDFLRKYRHLLAGLLILFIALQIPIYWKQDRSLGLPARVLYTLAYYPQSAYTWLTDSVGSITRHYFALVDVSQDNDRLKAQNGELRGKLHELRETEQENARLRALLGMRERSQFEGVAARIIALDASTWFQSFTIDIGTDDGVRHGMPVVSDEGLVGQIVSVAGRSAKVLPIVDMNSAIDVVDSRSRARGILVGRGRERAFLNYLERSEDVKEGDLLVTSGLGGALPPGLPVAVVREVRPKTFGLFQDAYVDTIVRFSRLENVLVLRYTDGAAVPAYVPPPPPITAAVAAVTAPATPPVAAATVQAPATGAPAMVAAPAAPAAPAATAATPKPRKPRPAKPAPAEITPPAAGPVLNLPKLEGGLSGGTPTPVEAANPESEKPVTSKPAEPKPGDAPAPEPAPATGGTTP